MDQERAKTREAPKHIARVKTSTIEMNSRFRSWESWNDPNFWDKNANVQIKNSSYHSKCLKTQILKTNLHFPFGDVS